MVRVIFDPTDVRLDGYFQVGGGSSGNERYFEGFPPYQRGYGWFAGMPRQRGAGLGDIFRSLWRVLKPLAKRVGPVLSSAGKAVGEEGLAATARILNDVVQGGDLKQSLVSEGREGVRNLLGRAERKLASQTGSGSKNNRKKRKTINKIILKPEDVVGRFVPARAIKGNLKNKRKRVDILGSY